MNSDVKAWLIGWFKNETGEAEGSIKNKLHENYLSNGWLDSFKFIYFITAVEETFNISFDNNEFQDRSFATIEGVAKIIERKIKENEG